MGRATGVPWRRDTPSLLMEALTEATSGHLPCEKRQKVAVQAEGVPQTNQRNVPEWMEIEKDFGSGTQGQA